MLSVQLFFAVLFLSWHFTPALAQPAAGASDYAKGTKLLVQGKDFEQAITLLQSAVKADPKNADYHLALGCAYADRAASLSYAYDWQYNMPTIQAPPKTFHDYTKDDGKPFLLSEDQAQSQIATLGQSARSEWQAAISFCKSKAARANAEYTEGWGIWALGIYHPKWTFGSGGMPGKADVIKSFQAATSDDPSRSAYWESLGFTSSDFRTTDKIDYEHALRLQPHNPALWYVLFGSYLQDAFNQAGISNAQKSYDSPAGVKAVAALKECVAQEPTNAYPMYELAYVDLDSTPYQNNKVNSAEFDPVKRARVDITMEASLTPADKKRATDVLALMDRAGKAPNCSAPSYSPPVPALLIAPWKYHAVSQGPDYDSYGHLRELARDFYGVSAADETEHNIPDAIHAQKAVIRMGRRLTGSWPVGDSAADASGAIQALVGIAIADIGYANLVKVEQKYGTPDSLKAAQSENQAFRSRASAYKDRLKTQGPQNIYSLY